jgi:hypothetical protein
MNSTAYLTQRSNLSRSTAAARRSRAGYAMVEVILAFAVFGIGLAGLFPFVLTQLKLTTKLETRFQGDVYYYRYAADQFPVHIYPTNSDNGNPNRYPDVTHQLVRWSNPRMRSFLRSGVIATDRPDPLDVLTPYQLSSAVITKSRSYVDLGVDYLPDKDDYAPQILDKSWTDPPFPYRATIYSYQIEYSDMKIDPKITIELDVEAP